MFAVIRYRRSATAGFTLLELAVVIIIIGVTLAVGIPKLTNWVMANKAAGASEFYLEGLRLARLQAVSHNAASRIVLTPNSSNSQLDWQVDLCFPTAAVPCTDASGDWSSSTTSAAGDPEGASGYTSVSRSAAPLPPLNVIAPQLYPAGASTIYYTALGWVDTGVANRLSKITFTPGSAFVADVAPSAVVVTLSGMPSKCDPTVAAGDSRSCPPTP